MLELDDCDIKNPTTHSQSVCSANPPVPAGICVSSGKTWSTLNAIRNQNHKTLLVFNCGYFQRGRGELHIERRSPSRWSAVILIAAVLTITLVEERGIACLVRLSHEHFG
jgi:hypothetical protein